jgi:8-oxo-dGTP pyrophosphatase MutT (NUDIX family)
LQHHAFEQLANYLIHFPEEAASLTSLSGQFAQSKGDIFSRANMQGHITTSAFVLNAAATHVLLIHHKVIGRWLQPGGHYEPAASLAASAAREVEEETGLRKFELHPWCVQTDAPFDIDSHAIAANPKKDEGAHVHHDYIYLFRAVGDDALTPQLEEVNAVKWLDLDSLPTLGSKRFERMSKKLQILVANKD